MLLLVFCYFKLQTHYNELVLSTLNFECRNGERLVSTRNTFTARENDRNVRQDKAWSRTMKHFELRVISERFLILFVPFSLRVLVWLSADGCIRARRLLSGTQSDVSCVVAVFNQLDAVNMSNGFTYKSQLTPVIAEVSPRRGGTAGGTRLTITGSGFRCSEGR